MTVDTIKNGIVIDHITAGLGMKIYSLLKLDDLDCQVALIKNAPSKQQINGIKIAKAPFIWDGSATEFS